jgi:CHAT domain-containing protein/tetratricopeptide (TPR) repeat protein
MHELTRHLSELLEAAYDSESGDRAQLSAEVAYSLSQLYEEQLPRAKGAFTLGYARWRSEDYYNAAAVLAEAAELFRQSGEEPIMEVTALSYRCDCLRNDKQFDETIECADDLKARALNYGFRGHEALALRDRGMAHSALGRETEALEALRAAIEIRRQLSEDEVREQSVIALPAFLNELGVTARKFGRSDEAMRSFLENVETHREEGDRHLQAIALSEIGYTYQHSGETDKAVEYLRQAIRVEEQNGPTPHSRRWRMQIVKMSSGSIHPFPPSEDEDEGAFDPEDVDAPIEDESEAYHLAEYALNLATRDAYDKAIALATRVLRWAIRQRDVHCQVVCRNVLGICHDSLGDAKRAISEFQKGIQLADGAGGGVSAALTLRYNLAKTYLNDGRQELCGDVLQSGIAHSQMALNQVDSFAFRQQVVSGALPLYELFALLLSHVDARPNHEHLLAITEVVRARNMATWAQIQAGFEKAAIPKDVADRVEERLRELRAIEVELDLRHLTDALTSAKAETLQRHTEMLHKEIEETANKYGAHIEPVKARRPTAPFREMEDALADVLSPGTAILSLFSIPEGICPAVFYRDDGGTKSAGYIIKWERDERLHALSRWIGETGHLRSRSTTPREGGESDDLEKGDGADAPPEQFLDQFLDLVQEHLFEEIVPVIQSFRPRRLAIIPHRDLALIPYWRVADSCDSIESMTLAPSLNLLRICVNRSRKMSGRTIIVPDVTGTLPKTDHELETVDTARKNSAETVSSVDHLIQVGPESNLLHIAAHGAFNSKNPYHSGYLMHVSEHVTDLFVQYATLAESKGETTFQFSDMPQPGSFRLMTVADCMARLSLKNCRLSVLSACESGLSDSHGGGELTGLPTSMLVGGAKSVIAAAWPVDDAATALLMDLFYQHWAGGSGDHSSPAHSLALARRDLKKMGRFEVLNLLGWDSRIPEGDRPFAHPIYSDAFHCFGDW